MREIIRILANAQLFLLLYSLVSSLSCRIAQCLISQIILHFSLITFLPRRALSHLKYYSILYSRNFPAAPCSVSFHRLRTCKSVVASNCSDRNRIHLILFRVYPIFSIQSIQIKEPTKYTSVFLWFFNLYCQNSKTLHQHQIPAT